MNVTLTAVFEASAADVAADDERRRGPGAQSSWRGRPANEREAVCWFDADAFGVEPWVLERAGDSAQFVNRIQEIVGPDGEAVVLQSGRRDTLPADAVSAHETGE